MVQSENQNFKYFGVNIQRTFEDTQKTDKEQCSNHFVGIEGADCHFQLVFWTKLIQIIGKFSEKTLNKPSFCLLSDVVSNWKKSLKDFNWISRKSG